jgi:hypothetical protein
VSMVLTGFFTVVLSATPPCKNMLLRILKP